jgi:drug/metabolite transporter (DMT)-like permease
MDAQPIRLPTALFTLGLCVLWGGNVVAIKFGLAAFPPLWSAFWRFLICCVVVLLWSYWRGLSLLPQRSEIRQLGILGCLFTAQIALLNLGINWTSPASGVVLLNANPIFANLLAHFVVPGDRLSIRRVTGLLIAFGGICVVFLGNPVTTLAERPMMGNLLVILTSLLLGVRVVYTNRLVQSIEPVQAVFWQAMGSLPVFLLCGWLFEPPLLSSSVPVASLLGILYQGVIVAGVCFVGWTILLKHYSPSKLSMFGFVSPIFGVLFSGLFFGELITSRLWIGLIAVTLGILLVTRQGSSPSNPTTGLVKEDAQ